MYKGFGIIVQTTEFEEGDIICHTANWNYGMPMFFKATSNDVKNYSGQYGIYLKLIQTSELESLEDLNQIMNNRCSWCVENNQEECGCES